MNDQPVDVVLVDNRIVIREGLCALIEQQSDLVVVAQAASVREAGALDVEADVVVTDVDLPDARYGDVISGLRAFFAATPILVLTRVEHPAKVQAAHRATNAAIHAALLRYLGTPGRSFFMTVSLRLLYTNETRL